MPTVPAGSDSSDSPSFKPSKSTPNQETPARKTVEEHGFLPIAGEDRDFTSNEHEDGLTLISPFPSESSQCDDLPLYHLLNGKNTEGPVHGFFVKPQNIHLSHRKAQSGRAHGTSSTFRSRYSYVLPSGVLASVPSSSGPHTRSMRYAVACNYGRETSDTHIARRLDSVIGPTIIILGMIALVFLSMALVEVIDRLWWATMVPHEEQPDSGDGEEIESAYKWTQNDCSIEGDTELLPVNCLRNHNGSFPNQLQQSHELVPWAIYSIPENQTIGSDAHDVVRHVHIDEDKYIESDEREGLLEEDEDREEDLSDCSDSDTSSVDSFPVL